MDELRIPYACDDHDNLVSPATAEKLRSYRCPACNDVVILRRGDLRQPHFAHRPSETCSWETALHRIGKRRVIQAVQDWKAGQSAAPLLNRGCRSCDARFLQPLPHKVERAEMEVRLADGSVADVALFAGGAVIAAVEIYVTHAVDEEKARRLTVPFIELDAQHLVMQADVWTPIQDGFNPLRCADCRAAFCEFQTQAAELAAASGVALPARYYRYAPWHCWKCRAPLLVFTWPGRGIGAAGAPCQRPIPRTIRFRRVPRPATGHWENACPSCGAVQATASLFEEHGPFFGLSLEDATQPGNWEDDLHRIARRHYDARTLLK